MPQTRLLFFQGADGTSPVWEWLKDLRARNPKAYAKCVVRIRRLVELGHDLRRPEADLLRDGIYELRARLGTVNYRILYFFHGRNVAVLAHAITRKMRYRPLRSTGQWSVSEHLDRKSVV